jgi:hypothetical protein
MSAAADWRRSLGRAIAGVLALKLLALLVIWALAFSPSRMPNVSPASMSRQLGLERAVAEREADHD